MCVKYLVLVLFQLYILVNPEPTTTVETIVSEEFEQVLEDFIFQYHRAKSDTGNATDICETPTKYINEDFNKSEFYKQFQLQKYLAEDSKCETLCLNVHYTIVENDLDHVTPIIPVPTLSDNGINGTVTIDTVTDTTSTEPASTENASTNTASTDIGTNTEGNQIDETTTVGSAGAGEDVESYMNSTYSESGRQTQEEKASGGAGEDVESYKNSTYSESGRQTQEEKASGGKKTAVIVAVTIMAVATVTAAFIPVVNLVKTFLHSGTYVFPRSPNV